MAKDFDTNKDGEIVLTLPTWGRVLAVVFVSVEVVAVVVFVVATIVRAHNG